jgi:hypothetical protein
MNPVKDDGIDACKGPGAAFRSYGSIVRLDASDDAILAAMRNRLPPFAEPIPQDVDDNEAALRLFLRAPGPCRCGESHVIADLFRSGAYQTGGSTLALLERAGQIAKFFVAEHASDRVFVHAGVVGWQGGAIVLPGRSMSGKTTLVRALVECGATYYSDEYAVFDDRGWVHPFPQPLGLRAPGHTTQHPASIESLGYSAGTAPLPVTALIVTGHTPGAVWAPVPLSRARATLELTSHAVPIVRDPRRVLDYLGAAAAHATRVSTARDDAADAAREILKNLGRE